MGREKTEGPRLPRRGGRTSFCESFEDSQFRKNSSSLSLDEGNLFTFGISTFPGVEEEVEGKGRSRQDERHNVQNEARCDPAEATAPAASTRDAPDVSISGTLCSPLTFTLSPAIAPATGVTHSARVLLRGAAKSTGAVATVCWSFELALLLVSTGDTVSIFEMELFLT